MTTLAVTTIILLVGIIQFNNAQKNVCSQTEKVDETLSKMYIFGAEDRQFPTTKAEMKGFCKTNTDLQKWLTTYKDKCLKGMSKELVSLMTNAVAKNTKAVCKSPKRTAEFLVIGGCGNAAKSETVKCWNNLTKGFNKASYHKDGKFKIPLICCNYFQFKVCNTKAYEAIPDKCSAKALDGQEKLINTYALDFLKYLCTDYLEETDKCTRIPDTYNNPVELKVVPRAGMNIINKIFESLKV